tara:strand:- start:1129 stop:2031 length:903 start_codon:yes stop_codon:yes gene_type:complete
MKLFILIFFLLAKVCGDTNVPSILIFNEFDSKIIDQEKLELSNFFPTKDFIIGDDVKPFSSSVDSMNNPASGRMSIIRELGNDLDIDYVLFHKINKDSNRFYLEGQMFRTESGGMIHRRIVDITNYYKGHINELKLWVGDVFNEIDKEWVEYRKMVLFQNPEDIIQEKTPEGAMARSLMVPGWGQFYSDKPTSGKIWAGIEASLITAIIASYIGYNNSVKGFKSNTSLYESSSEQIEFNEYRNQVDIEWKKHKDYNSAMIYSAITAGSLWVLNGIHAYIVGPRPKKDIIQKWDKIFLNSK